MASGKQARPRRKVLGTKSSRTRAALVEATGRLLWEKGYGAVTSRAIAEEAGVAHQLIFYYFKTLDDLLVEVFREESEARMERLNEALEAEQPLRAFWDIVTDARLSRIVQEFVALANHNNTVRTEISRHAIDFRARITEVVAAYLEAKGIEPIVPPSMLVMLMTGLGRMLVNDAALGYADGHAEARALVEACLQQIERAEKVSAPSSARKIFPKKRTRR